VLPLNEMPDVERILLAGERRSMLLVTRVEKP
jgi:hypothetical protein